MIGFLGYAFQQAVSSLGTFSSSFLVFSGGYFVPSNDGMLFFYEGLCLEREENASKVSLTVFHMVVSLKVYLGSGTYSIGQSVLVSN